VAVKIKLKRLGKIRAPYYRIVIADSRTKRDGRAIEEIGKYHPKAEPSFIEVNSERAQHWLSVGAQPTDPVRKIFEITGDWQKFKGLPGAEGTLRTAEPRADRKEAFAAAVAENLTESGAKSKPKGRAADAKAGEAKAGGAKADTAKADTAKADTAKADTAKADTAKADTAKAGPAKADTGKAEKPARAKKAEPTPAAPAAEPNETAAAAEATETTAAAEPTETAAAAETAAAPETPAEEAAAADAAATAEAKAEAIAEVAEDSAPVNEAGETEGSGA
jgi:small subunit ribosomal protein S16